MESVDRDSVHRVPNGGWDRRVSVYRCGDTVDSFVVRTQRFVLVIDTLVSQSAMRLVMNDLGRLEAKQPLLVINTHGDWDHVWGNGLFSGVDARFPAPIVGSSLTPARMLSPDADALLAEFRQKDPRRYATSSWQPPTVTFGGDGEIDGGDLTLQLLATPGHTLDHLSIWVPELRLLLAGDAAEAPLPWVSTAQALPALRASLYRLAGLGARTVLYCHARGVTGPELIQRNIAYFEDLEMRCRRVRAEGAEPITPESWPLEAAVGDVSLEGDQDLFYRAAHAAAIAATTEWIESTMTKS